MRPFNPSLRVEPFRHQQVVDAGDIACNPFDLVEAISQIEAGAVSLLGDGKGLIALGGDHTMALPMLRAMKKVHGPVALVHFDAHLDTWPTYFGAPYTHGTPFRAGRPKRVSSFLAEVRTWGFAARSMGRAIYTEDAVLGFQMFNCLDIDRVGVTAIIEQLRDQVGDLPTYLSIDIDVLDPAFAPGTGTPESAGLNSRELMALVRGFAGANIVGGDVVEVSPPTTTQRSPASRRRTSSMST